MNRRSLFHHVPGMGELAENYGDVAAGRSHANRLGLNPFGLILLEEMMMRGMVIDIDHMSQKALDTALDLAEHAGYPVISSHSWFRDLAFTGDTEFNPRKPEDYDTGDVHKVAHENAKRADQVERIARLGGVIAPILSQGDVDAARRIMPHLADKIPEPSAGSGTSWAEAYLYVVEKTGGRGVAMGSDINGAADLPGPRFGTLAAFESRNDPRRADGRRRQIENQRNGVSYDQPIRDYRWFRFDEGGSGGYDDAECNVWNGIAEYKAGFNPWIHKHPPEDYPAASIRRFFERAEVQREEGLVDDIARGLWAADEEERTGQGADTSGWPPERRAAYLVHKGAALQRGRAIRRQGMVPQDLADLGQVERDGWR